MTLPEQFLLSDLLKHRVRCDQGLDHGPGLMCWMHPPVHRVLGWFSRPSSLNLSRCVWKLNQLRGIGEHDVYVKGSPSNCDQSTMDRIPTLLDADVLNVNGQKLGTVVDCVFQPKSGQILHYLVSRTDPRIPGTSRWRLLVQNILDQQPGMISINVNCLDDMPIAKSSIKQDFLRRSRNWREQIQEFSDHAGTRLEGWLEEPPWEEFGNVSHRVRSSTDLEPFGDWDDDFQNQKSKDHLQSSEELGYPERPLSNLEEEDDPWI